MSSAASPATAAPAATAAAQPYDRALILIVGILMTLGAVMVYSASVQLHVTPDWRQWWNSPLRQCVFAVGGFVAMILAARFDYRWLAWQRGPLGGLAPALLAGLSVALLIAVLIPGVGTEVLGAQRAIQVLRSPVSIGFQPSEIAKVVLAIWLAAVLTRPAPRTLITVPTRTILPGATLGLAPAAAAAPTRATAFSGLLLAVGSSGAMIALTGIEDFGTAALMGVAMMALLYIGGAPWRYLLSLVLLAGAAGAALLLMKSYRLKRLATFFSEAPDAQGEGYQILQALLAIGAGGWWGRGLGQGIRKFDYVPQDNNDFILAIVCEELGVAGGLLVVALFIAFVARGWQIAARSGDPFGRLLAAGLTLLIGLQAVFNIAVVTNSVPTKGISLPFISAGGSGVVVLGAAAGLIASVARSRVARIRG